MDIVSTGPGGVRLLSRSKISSSFAASACAFRSCAFANAASRCVISRAIAGATPYISPRN